jgi:hypothetical protein
MISSSLEESESPGYSVLQDFIGPYPVLFLRLQGNTFYASLMRAVQVENGILRIMSS